MMKSDKSQTDIASLPTRNIVDLEQVERLHLNADIKELKDLKIDPRLASLEEYRRMHTEEHKKILNVPNVIIAILTLVVTLASVWISREFDEIKKESNKTNKHVARIHDRINELGLYPQKFFNPLPIEEKE